jgi:polygalacturonase
MATDRRSLLAAAALLATAATRPISAKRAPGQAPELPGELSTPTTGIRFDPREFGAKADGASRDTIAIQRALDRCAVMGGGEVLLAGGTFLSGAIRIGSDTTLRIAADAVLLGSPDIADYPIIQVRWEGRWVSGHAALVWAQDARNVRLTGKGRIVASAAIPGRIAQSGLRNPALIELIAVRGLSITDLTTHQNDMWSIHPVYCEDAIFRGLTVRGGADGIDVDSCSRVLIDQCDFDTADDCISLKSGRGMEGNLIARPTQDVTISNCSFRDRRWACIGIGSETSGGIRRVLVEHCRFLAAYTFSVYIKSRPGRGAFIEDIVMRDLDVSEAGNGFLRLNFLDSGKQDQFPVAGYDGIPHAQNFVFEDVRVRNVPVLVEAVSIHPDKPLKRFILRNITGTADRGIQLANIQKALLTNIDVIVATGPKIAVANVEGHGLDGAVQLTIPGRPAVVYQTEPAYKLGQMSSLN